MNTEYRVLLYYKFTPIEDPAALRDSQRALCEKFGIKGRILVGTEGINGTCEGTREAVQAYMDTMHADERFSDMVFKESWGNGEAFKKLKVKVRKEIVALGAPRSVDPSSETAPTVSAEELEEWYENDEDFVVLDLRNDYELKAGLFDNTVHPGISNFRELPEKIDDLASDPRIKDKKVVTVCNGGIRCEKATCLMDSGKFPNLYQLENGIFDYMKKFPNRHFKGTMLVFDDRGVDDVGAGPNHEVIGKCDFCGEPTEQYVNDDSVTPSQKLLCCDVCLEVKKKTLRPYSEFIASSS